MAAQSLHDMLSQVLARAASQNPDILKPAEANLKEWESQSGFYSALLDVLLNDSSDVAVKWMAVLYLKNGIEKYWRWNPVNHALTVDEKAYIKKLLLTNFTEPINQIAVQRAIIVAKIARIDCPKDWSELFPTILQAIQNADNNLMQNRALLTLHHVIKAISSKRLMGDRRFFQDFTTKVYTYIVTVWDHFLDVIVQIPASNLCTDEGKTLLENALLALKVLHMLSVFGFYKPHEHDCCMQFIRTIFQRIKTVCQFYKQITFVHHSTTDLCRKLIVRFTKILISMLDTHPFSYIDFIHASLSLTVYYLFTAEGNEFMFERFTIQCFSLLKQIVICSEYKPPKHNENCKYPEMLKAHSIKVEFFQADTLAEICRKLVFHYFLLTDDELNMWIADPETFACNEIGDSWKYSLRPSTETVFVAIFHEFRSIMIPIIVNMIGEVNNMPSNIENFTDILRKDAVYNAVCLSAFDLYDEVDFDQWFSNFLCRDLEVHCDAYKIIRRRVCMLVGTWVNIKMSSELRPLLYQHMLRLLHSDEDLIVRITAADTVRYAIDNFEFSEEQFVPYLSGTFSLLFELLRCVQDDDTKIHMLNVLCLLSERLGEKIVPYAAPLVHYLVVLWEQSDSRHMLKCGIVSILVQLIKAMGTVSEDLRTVLFSIIQLGTDTSQDTIVYLLEDSLELWLALLENTTEMSNHLVQLFNNMPTLLDYSTENLRICLFIVLVHTLLAPELVLEMHGSQIITVCNNLFSDMKNEAVVMLLKMVEGFVKCSPIMGSRTILPILPRIMQKVYEGEEYPLLMSMYLSIISRVLLSSHEIFAEALISVAQRFQEHTDVTLGKFLDVWMMKMFQVSQLDQRKLLALGLCNLLTAQSAPVLERFPMVLTNILESLNDVTKSDEDGNVEDSLLLVDGRCPDDFIEDCEREHETFHDKRHKELLKSDPVHTITLKEYLQTQLNELKNQVGLMKYMDFISKIDTETASQLKQFVQL